jgi:hypothetical protein
MGDIAEISFINLNMMSNDKENKEDNNNSGVCDNGGSFSQFNWHGKCSYEYLMPFIPGVEAHEVPCYNLNILFQAPTCIYIFHSVIRTDFVSRV